MGTGGPGTPNPIGRFGTGGAGYIEGPGTIRWNFGLAKHFNLTEGVRMKFEVSFTDVLNHTNLGDPDMNITDTNGPNQCGFGCISAGRGFSDFAGGRTGQIGARIDF